MRELGANWFVLSRPELKELANVLESHEEIDAFVYGSCEGGMSFLVATDRRLLYVNRQFFKSRVDNIPFVNVTSVEHRPGLLMGQAVVHTTSNDYTMSRVVKQQLERFCRVAERRMHEANQTRRR